MWQTTRSQNSRDRAIWSSPPISRSQPRCWHGAGHALNPRGEFYTQDNIREYLTLRNFMDGLRAGGVDTGGPAPFAMNDRQMFANQLDRFLARKRGP